MLKTLILLSPRGKAVMERVEKIIKTTIRLPLELSWETKRDARKEGTTFNEYIVSLLWLAHETKETQEIKVKQRLKKAKQVGHLENEITKLNILIENEHNPEHRELLDAIRKIKKAEVVKIREEEFSNH